MNNDVLPFNPRYCLEGLSFIFKLNTSKRAVVNRLNTLATVNTERDKPAYLGAFLRLLLIHVYAKNNQLMSKVTGIQMMSLGYSKLSRYEIISNAIKSLKADSVIDDFKVVYNDTDKEMVVND